VIVAPVLVIPLIATFEITGVPVVVNVVLPEVAEVFPAFADTTSKSYSVPAVKPVSVTEWLVTNVVFTAVELPYAVVGP
jgi:hypothetical protein